MTRPVAEPDAPPAERPRTPAGRLVAAAVLALLPALALLVARSRWDDLPARLPSHWTGAYPDGFSTTTGMWTATLVIALVAAAVGVAGVLLRRRTSPASLRWLLVGAAVVGFASAAVWLAAVVGTHTAGSPEQVHTLWALGPMVAALLWGAITYAVHGRPPAWSPSASDAAARIEPAPLSPGAPEQWSTEPTSALLGVLAFVVAGVTAVLAAVMVADSGSWYGAGFMLLITGGTIVVVGGMAWAQLTVDRRGLRLGSRLVPLTLKRVPLARVSAVSVERIDPGQWGGWGYRVMPGRSAYVVHGGPGLVLDLVDGKRFAVEVTEGREAAEEGAAVLEALVADELTRQHHARDT